MLKKISPARAATALVVLIFVVKSIAGIVHLSGRLHDQDTGSEDNTITGSKAFIHDGFAQSCGLPKYGRYNLDSPSKPILESDYYTHYFPGPDYILTIVYKIFSPSDRATQWARLIPFLHFLLASLLFLWLAQTRLWPRQEWATPIVAAFILFAPANRAWIYNLHGHGYVSAYTLFALSLGMWAASTPSRKRLTRSLPLCLVAACLGFASNYMLLTNAFVVCAAPLVGALLVTGAAAKEDKQTLLTGFWLSFSVGLGLVGAYIVHLVQIACMFNWHEALLDQLGTFSARIHKVEGLQNNAAPATRIQLLGRYSDHVYTFFGMSSFAMLVVGLLFSGRQKRHQWAMVLAVLAAYAWILALPSHARAHYHVNPRIFLLPWVTFLCLAVRACQKIRQS